jgi:phage-related protein
LPTDSHSSEVVRTESYYRFATALNHDWNGNTACDNSQSKVALAFVDGLSDRIPTHQKPSH